MFEYERKALKRVVMALRAEFGERLIKVVAFGSRLRGDYHLQEY